MNRVIDVMDNAAQWKALAPDQVTPSTELSISDDKTIYQFGDDQTSGRIQATEKALGHVLRRNLNVDLSDLDELRLWGRADHAADGSSSAPFFLELKFASAEVGFDNAQNTWRRPLPFFHPGSWELIRLSLADLPAQILAGASAMQLKVINAGNAFQCNLDTCLGVKEEMLADVEAELLAKTDKKVKFNGTALPAVMFNPDVAAPALPYIRITPYEVQLNEQRSVIASLRMDYTETGFRVLPQRIGYDLFYDFEVYANDRRAKTSVYEYLLRLFAPRSSLVVNGVPLLVEYEASTQSDYVTPERVDRTMLRFKVQTWQSKASAGEPAKRPYAKVTIETGPLPQGSGV
jgi:hypothetical protein